MPLASRTSHTRVHLGRASPSAGSLPLYVIHRYYIFVFIDRADKDACLLACSLQQLSPQLSHNHTHSTCPRMFVAPRRQSGVAHYTSPRKPTVNHLPRPRRPSADVAPTYGVRKSVLVHCNCLAVVQFLKYSETNEYIGDLTKSRRSTNPKLH